MTSRTVPISVMVADGQLLFAESLGRALGLEPDFLVVGEYPTVGTDAVNAVLRHRPDVLLYDYWMLAMDGPAASRAIGAKPPRMAGRMTIGILTVGRRDWLNVTSPTNGRVLTMRVNRTMGAAAVVAAGVLGFASHAWGCASVTSPFVESSPNRGQAATVTTVSGGNWAKSSSLTVHWATANGPVLTTTVTDTAGAFTADVTVPADVAPKMYYLVAVQGSGATEAVRNTPFQVMAPAGGANQAQTTPAGSTSASTSGGNASSTPAAPSTGSPASTNGSVTGGGLPTPDAVPAPANAASAASEQRQTTAASAVDTASVANVSSRPAAAPRLAAERTRAAGVAGAPNSSATPAPVPSSDNAASPSPASATGDVWGGFAEGPSRLSPSLADLPSPGSSSSPAVVGGMVAVLALVGLVGGFATAELRRRRVLVSGGSGR